jgi:hypothetical protein
MKKAFRTESDTRKKMKAAMPKPVYGCGNECCAAEFSWPAEDIFWCEHLSGWYCMVCVLDMFNEPGISLKEFMGQKDYLSVDIFEEDSL